MKKLIVTEAKCAWRAPVGLALGVLVPVIILVILGSADGLQKTISGSNPPVTYMTTYVPVLIGLVLVMIALVSLPIVLVNQREHAFLRRVSTTPVAPRWLLAAQVVVNFVLAVVAMILIVAGATAFLPRATPRRRRSWVALSCRRCWPQRPCSRSACSSPPSRRTAWSPPSWARCSCTR